MSRYFNNTLLNGSLNYFGAENPFNNPNLQTYYAASNGMTGPTPIKQEPYRGAPYGGGSGQVAPREEFAKGTNVKTGAEVKPPPEYVSQNYDPEGYYSGPEPGTNGRGRRVDQRQNEQGGDRDFFYEIYGDYLDVMRENNDPELLRRRVEVLEPYYTRMAQKKHRMGLANIEAAGKAAFNYKYGPQMMMTAAASRAAYYPEMVRSATDSFTGLNLANAMKPRMSGYFSGAYRA